MSQFKIIEVPKFADSRGSLFVAEKLLPFEAKRIFWIVGAENALRGGHRHHQTRQALIALRGSVRIFMSDSVHEDTIVLDQPEKCLIVEPEDWHTMEFDPGSILIVFASEFYNRDDYIDEKYSS